MSIQHWPQRFKYHYKKYLAIFFVSLAVAFIAGDLILSFVSMILQGTQPGLGIISRVLSFVILMVSYVMIFKGNVEGTGLAFQGVLSFVFLLLFSEIVSMLLNSIDSGISLVTYFRDGSYVLGSITLVSYLLIVLQVVAGIFSYIRLRQYMLGHYVSSLGVKVWFMIYFGLFILGVGATLAIFFLRFPSSDWMKVFIALLEPISELCCGISCIFTVLRISD